MRTQVRQEDVRFGIVQQVGRKSVIIWLADGSIGQTRRLLLSHLRRVETMHGNMMFATGQMREINKDDEVAYIPGDDDFCLWVLRDEYDTAVSVGSPRGTPAL